MLPIPRDISFKTPPAPSLFHLFGVFISGGDPDRFPPALPPGRALPPAAIGAKPPPPRDSVPRQGAAPGKGRGPEASRLPTQLCVSLDLPASLGAIGRVRFASAFSHLFLFLHAPYNRDTTRDINSRQW